MNSKIQIGAVVYGTAGIGCKVLAVDGDVITIETPRGEGKISIARVVKVESTQRQRLGKPRSFVLGDRVRYVGDRRFQEQYAGVLKIWELGKGCDLDKCTCLKPNGRTTSWIEYSDLILEDNLMSHDSG